MHGRQRLPRPGLTLTLVLQLILLFIPPQPDAREVRRSMSYIRPYLMGDAHVAVADEASVLFYNPAGIKGIGATSAELFAPQLQGDELVKLALLNPDGLSKQFEGISQTNFSEALDKTLYFDLNLKMPATVIPTSGLAYGIGAEVMGNLEFLQNPVLPGVHMEFFVDQVMFFTLAFNFTDRFSFGFTPKLIQRYGVDAIFTIGELFAAGNEASLDNHPAFKDAAAGNTFSSVGLDLGFLYRFPFVEDWHPRMGVSMLNIGPNGSHPMGGPAGMEFGPRPGPYNPPQAGELPQINTIGLAVSPTIDFIRYTVALDYVDFTRTIIPGKSHNMRTRVGFEMGIGPREDGTAILSLLAGLNAGHFSAGIMSRVTIFELGFGYYEVERGAYVGDRPDKRYVFIFGFRL